MTALVVCVRGHVRATKTKCRDCDNILARERRAESGAQPRGAGHYVPHIRLPQPPDWIEDAACLGHDPELWFAGTTGPDAAYGRYAQQVCSTCPVAAECLQYALAAEGHVSDAYRFGIYGGLTVPQRTQLARKGAKT